MKRFGFALLAMAVSLPTPAWSQAYPAKPVRLVTEFLAGSGGDTLLRIFAGGLSQALGQAVVIDNRGGAGGVVAAEAVLHAPPDGYTILGVSPNTQVIRVHLARSTPFNPQRDFTPIGAIADPTIIIIANPSVPASNLKELVEHAKRNPGRLSYATSGVGSAHHLSGEQIKMLTGADIVHVPYKGLAESLKDVVTGQIPFGFNLSGPSGPLIKAGKVKVLAVIHTSRSALWPDVPTATEAVPGFEPPPAWTGLFGPAGLPPAIVRRINADAMKAVNQPEVKAKISAAGFNVINSTPEEFAARIKREIDLVGKIVKAAGIQATE